MKNVAAETLIASVENAPMASRADDTLNQSWKNDKSKFGFKMLQKMGWTEGKGLGKNEDGMSEHVKVAKKSNNLGLGAKSDSTGADGWSKTAASFNGVLEALGKAYGSATTRNNNGRGDDNSGNRIRKKKRKDKKRGNKGDADGSSRNGKEGVGGAQAASHCPSRARRVRSKDVKAFSSADLRAILGVTAPASSNPSATFVRYNVREASNSDGSGGGADEEEMRTTKYSKRKKLKRRKERGGGGGEGGDDGNAASPYRPRTRSMDLVEVEVTTPAGKRRRTKRVDRAESEGSEFDSGGQGGTGEAALTPASRPLEAKKGKKKDKSALEPGRRGVVAGEGERDEGAPARRKRKKRKKSKDGSDTRGHS